jgi:hypothetical protein
VISTEGFVQRLRSLAGPAVFVQPCRFTMALIQIGAKGDVQPFETGRSASLA